MKKLFVILAFVSFGALLSAQVNPNAIGLRFYGGSYNGAEISYQKGLSSANRLELDLSFGFGTNYSRLLAVGVYQWVWNIDGGFNWYVGPGVSLSLDNYKHYKSYLNVGIGGQIGVEYNFLSKDIPLLISLDARPMYDLIGDHAGIGWGAALGIRYLW